MQATLFLISQPHLSAARFAEIAARLRGACPVLSAVCRTEGTGPGVFAELDGLRARGASAIRVQPVGLPVSDSLMAWLPGALGEWLAKSGNGHVRLTLSADPSTDAAVLERIAASDPGSRCLVPDPRGTHGKGWDSPPPFRHHLLVCTGPRCHLRDAPSLAEALKAELGRFGLVSACLIATTSCLYPCNRGPVVLHYPAGDWYRMPDRGAVRRFVRDVLVACETQERSPEDQGKTVHASA